MMAPRKRTHAPTQEADWITGLIALIVAIPVGWVGWKCTQVDLSIVRTFGYILMAFGWGLPSLFLAIVLGTVLWAIILNASHQDTHATAQTVVIDPVVSARAKITSTVDQHLETLARRRLALVSVDHYGVVQSGAWNKEVQHFADKVVRPALTEAEANALARIGMNAVFQELVEDRVAKRIDEIEAEFDFETVKTPIDFERWCAKVLENGGWSATVTKASGDQGADVLAQKNGRTIVLQCKLYSGVVGNGAVQEAFSAQRHYLTDRSAVVTNAQFTKSAHELAGTTKVLLLHYSDLVRLDAMLENST